MDPRTKATLACAVVIAVGLIGAGSAHAALSLTNGSFENPDVGNGGAEGISAGSTKGGWTNHSNSDYTLYYVDEGHNSTNESNTANLNAQGSDTQIDGEDDQIFELFYRFPDPGEQDIQYQSLGTVGSTAVNATLDALFAWRRDQAEYPDYRIGLYTDNAGTSPLGETVKSNHSITDWTRVSASASNIAPGTEVFAVIKSSYPSGFDTDNNANQLFIEDMQLTTTVIPEPGSLALLAPAGLALMRRRRRS